MAISPPPGLAYEASLESPLQRRYHGDEAALLGRRANRGSGETGPWWVEPAHRSMWRRIKDRLQPYPSEALLLHRLSSGARVPWLLDRFQIVPGSPAAILGTVSDFGFGPQPDDRPARLLGQVIHEVDHLRAGLARSLHRDVVGALTAVRMQVELAASGLGPIPLSPETGNWFGAMLTHVDLAVAEVRAVTDQLCPAVLPSFGLLSAIETAARRHHGAGNEVRFHGSESKEATPVRPEQTAAIFEMVSEVLKLSRRYCRTLQVSAEVREASLEFTITGAAEDLTPSAAVGLLEHFVGSVSAARAVDLGAAFGIICEPGRQIILAGGVPLERGTTIKRSGLLTTG